MPTYALFAPSKAAQRILAQSLARELGPKGVHVAYIVIDAMIDLRWTRRQFPDVPEERMAKPDDIAEVVFQTAHQPKTAWSFNVEVRPSAETW